MIIKIEDLTYNNILKNKCLLLSKYKAVVKTIYMIHKVLGQEKNVILLVHKYHIILTVSRYSDSIVLVEYLHTVYTLKTLCSSETCTHFCD